MKINRKVTAIVLTGLATSGLILGTLVSQSLKAQQTPSGTKPAVAAHQADATKTSTHKKDDDDAPPQNLQILPKNMTGEQLHKIMRGFSQSLGVRCGFCHVIKEGKPGERPTADFASDAKREKQNAREMMKMTGAINANYLQKIDHSFEEITCVSCHHGSVRPMTSVDSLPHANMPKAGEKHDEKHEEHHEEKH